MGDEPRVALINGDARLQAPPWMQTWGELVRWQFVQAIQDGFDDGADVVVLAFAQAPTQCQRPATDVAFECDGPTALAPSLPEDRRAMAHNPAYRNKAVRRVLDMVHAEFAARPEHETARRRALVLDWHGQQRVLRYNPK